MWHRLPMWWGVLGFAAILSQAIYRLFPLALEPIERGLLVEWWHVALYLGSIAFNGYFEGYRAFQLQVAPRVVARAMYLTRNPRPLFVLLAPLFCMSLFHATRRRLVLAWSVYVGIVILIVAVRQLAQPWRGMVDAGVVVGLSWGVLSLLFYFVRGLEGRDMPAPADLPDELD